MTEPDVMIDQHESYSKSDKRSPTNEVMGSHTAGQQKDRICKFDNGKTSKILRVYDM